jgi:hypothetical protein
MLKARPLRPKRADKSPGEAGDVLKAAEGSVLTC